MRFDLSSTLAMQGAQDFLNSSAINGKVLEIKVVKSLNDGTEVEKPRTNQQNRALHLMFRTLADTLNEAGMDMKRTLKPDVDISWSGDLVKEYLWRPIQKAQLRKESTTALTTKEIDQVFETLTRHLGQKLGIEIEFPSIESLINKGESNV